MKRLLAFLALTCAAAASFGATLNPIQLLNPAGSTAGQTIVSTGASSAPGWGTVPITGLSSMAANTVLANFTGSSAAPTAFAMPSCIGSANALQYSSGTGIVCGSNYALLSSPAFNGTPTAPTAAAHTNTIQLATTAFVETEFASPPAIGNTTPSTGKFTTLTTTAMSRVKAGTTNAQSIPNNAFTTITTFTTTQNQGANFVASTGVYTAPSAGDYDVRASFRASSVTPAATSQFIVAVLVNGSVVKQSGSMTPSSTDVPQASLSVLVTCNANDTITVQVFQNTGGAVTLDGTVAANWLEISQLP